MTKIKPKVFMEPNWKMYGDLYSKVGSVDMGVQQTIEWAEAYERAYISQSKDLNALHFALFDGKQIVGVLPLQIRKVRSSQYTYYNRIEIFGRGPTDFFRPIAEEGYEGELQRQFCSFLIEEKNCWDRLYISEIIDLAHFQTLLSDCNEISMKLSNVYQQGYFSVNTTGNWDDFYNETLKPKNKDLWKAMRRIKNDGFQLSVQTYNTNIYDKLRNSLELYAQRRESLGQNNSYETDSRNRFVKKVCEQFEASGQAEFSVLLDQYGELWSFQLDWIFCGTRFHWNHAYNEKFKRYSPGKYLLYSLLKSSFEKPKIHRVNHMRGLADYKKSLTDQQNALYAIEAINPYSRRLKIERKVVQLARFKNKLIG